MLAPIVSLGLLCLAGTRAPLAFEGPHDWVLLDRKGHVLERLESVGGLRPAQLVLSDDATMFVFTARDQRVQGHDDALWKWKRGTPFPERLGHATGLHAHPWLSPDDQWVYYSYHPDPTLMGVSREYTQIWRVRIDGAHLEQLTQSSGCKLHPTAMADSSLIYSHAECEAHKRGVELLKNGKPRWLLPSRLEPFGEPAVSPNGKQIAATQVGSGSTKVVMVELASGKERALSQFGLEANRTGLAWLSEKELVLAIGARVVALEISGTTVVERTLVDFSEGER